MPDQIEVDNRKDLLLLLLAAAGGEPVVGVTRLLKYVFLLQHGRGWGERFHLAEPYDFGAYHRRLFLVASPSWPLTRVTTSRIASLNSRPTRQPPTSSFRS